MNLQPYRSSFQVFVSGSLVERTHEVVRLLSNVGYSCEYKLKPDSLMQDIFKNPPHIVILFYDDVGFYADRYEREKTIEKLLAHLPELQIILLVNGPNMSAACDLYDLGVYACIEWPGVNSIQLLKCVDHAAENNYHMFLNEQLKEKLLAQDVVPTADFTLFDIFVKGMEVLPSRAEMIELWMKEATRVHDLKDALFMSYIETKKSLLVTHSFGFKPEEVKDVGLDLIKEEPGFEESMLARPEKLISLHQFVLRGLHRREALYYSLIEDGKVVGVFVLPAREGEMFSVMQLESPYLKMCLHLMTRQIEFNKLKEKFQSTTIYDEKTGVLTRSYFIKKLNEEISRARRILKPVALIQICIDGYSELTLSLPSQSMDLFLSAFAEVLIKNSRLNDMMARIERDVFVVCLPHTDKRGAIVKAERLRRLFSNADFEPILGPRTKVTVSVGISEYPSISNDSPSLLRSSEQSMFQVKKVGGNRIQLANPPAHFVPDFMVENGKTI